MRLTSRLFEAFLKCPTKCYLRSVGEAGSSNAYAEWVQAHDETYRAGAAKQFTQSVPEFERVVAPPSTENIKSATWRLAVDVQVQTSDMEARLHAVERLPIEGRG